MRILYCALDQTVPGTKGGSVHVTAVAEGLAARGHDVHVLATPGGAFPAGAVHWIPMTPPFGRKELRWTRAAAVRTLARAIRPDVIIERYYNFGGEGMSAAAATGALAVLEVNAPVVDYPGSPKRLLDRLLLVEPMRRWRERMCSQAHLIVTPNREILPAGTPASKIVELEWGADTDRFRPGAAGPVPFARPADIVAVFAGAFRAWHGAIHLAHAIGELRSRGRNDIGAVFIGDGPEQPRVRQAAAGLHGVVFTGAVPHEQMPASLAACDIGVAPFDLARHGPLALGFYWSPLKIFEYMAAGLPVVAPAIARIPALVEHEREGLLYEHAPDMKVGPTAGRPRARPDAAPGALAASLERLADPDLRGRLGREARSRAVREYSWKAHCAALERGMIDALARRA